MKHRILLSGLLALVVASWFGLAFAQEATTGSIDGTATDPAGQPLSGVTVTITSAQGTRTAVTRDDGVFRFPYLTPGAYNLSATLHGYTTAERQDIQVRLGARVRVEVLLTPGISEKIEVVGSAPVVDLSTTTTGANINSAMMSSVPLGRSFSNTLGLAPGVVASGIDASNPSIAGSSGLENTYVVDGMSIGNTGYGSAGSYSIVYGSLGTGVNYDYIEEVQIKTGGYEPEYGEALGGYINLITKSGTNTFGGSIFGYLQLKDMEADRVRTDRINASNDLVGFGSQDYGFAAGGPVIKDKAFWFAAFDPTFTTRDRRTAAVLHEYQGLDTTLTAKRTIYNYAVNLKWLLNPRHTLSVSAFGDPSVGEVGAQRGEAVAQADPTMKFSKITYGGNNFVGHWNGELLTNLFVEGMAAYHTDTFSEEPDQALLPGGIDRRPQHEDQFIPPIRYGGVGFYEDATSKNFQYQLKLSNFLQAAGEHNLRYGIIYQDIRYDETPNYSGPTGIEIVTDPGADETYGTADDTRITSSTGYTWDINASGSRFRINRIRSSSIGVETKAHYTAGFLSDTWNPTKYLSIMAGIRYEQEKLLGNLNEFTWDNNWSPRLHLTVDPTMDNRTKFSFAYGRFFGKVPNDLAVRALSEEKTYLVYYDLDAVTAATTDWNNPQGLIPANQFNVISFGDVPTRIDEDAKLSYLDEFVIGAERELRPFLNFGVSYMHRELGRTMEDVQTGSYVGILEGTEDFGEYVIANPGPKFGDPKPKRNYDAVTFKLDRRLHDNWQFMAAYTWSRLRGNYEGYFRRDNGQSDPFITSLYDFNYLANPSVWGYTSASGPLPSDRPYVLTAYGSYRLDNGLNVGMSVALQSGIPLTKMGFNEVYGNGGEIVLEPRGASGRSAGTADIALHMDYPIPLGLGGNKKLEASVDVFNLLNNQTGVEFEYDYELGGTVEVPAELEGIIDPCPECVNPDFGKATLFQDPMAVRLALRATF